MIHRFQAWLDQDNLDEARNDHELFYLHAISGLKKLEIFITTG